LNQRPGPKWRLLDGVLGGTEVMPRSGEYIDEVVRRCWLKVLGCCAFAFLALASGAANLEKYLYIPAAIWIFGGTLIVGAWAYETYYRAESLE
jgi:hypothetical protein